MLFRSGKKISAFAATCGDTIRSMSSDNEDMKKSMNQQNSPTVIIQQNNMTQSQTPYVFPGQKPQLPPTMQ